jgi:hypothetical protein
MAMAAMEAMSQGLVPILTPVGEIPRYAQTGHNAILVNCTDPAPAIREIAEAIQVPSRYSRLSYNARKASLGQTGYASSLFTYLRHVAARAQRQRVGSIAPTPPIAYKERDQTIDLTFIIAALNSSDTILRCLDSLYAQEDQNFEVIVKDGGSIDNTVQIVRNHPLRARLLATKDSGVYSAWNQALSLSTGSYIQFLGSDDYLQNVRYTALALRLIRRTKSRFPMLITSIHKDGKTARQSCPTKALWLNRSMRSHLSIPHPGLLHRRDLFQTRAFSPHFKISGDYEFILSLIRARKHRPVGVANCVTSTRMSPGGLSDDASKNELLYRENLRARRQNGFPGHTIWFILWRTTRAFWCHLPTEAIRHCYRSLAKR